MREIHSSFSRFEFTWYLRIIRLRIDDTKLSTVNINNIYLSSIIQMSYYNPFFNNSISTPTINKSFSRKLISLLTVKLCFFYQTCQIGRKNGSFDGPKSYQNQRNEKYFINYDNEWKDIFYLFIHSKYRIY